MGKWIVSIIFAVFLGCSALAQSNEEIILYSLEFLNKKLHLNFDKASEPILVFCDNDYYICNKYNHNTTTDLNRFKIHYTIEKKSENKYSFILEWAGEIKGTFDVHLAQVFFHLCAAINKIIQAYLNR